MFNLGSGSFEISFILWLTLIDLYASTKIKWFLPNVHLKVNDICESPEDFGKIDHCCLSAYKRSEIKHFVLLHYDSDSDMQ